MKTGASPSYSSVCFENCDIMTSNHVNSIGSIPVLFYCFFEISVWVCLKIGYLYSRFFWWIIIFPKNNLNLRLKISFSDPLIIIYQVANLYPLRSSLIDLENHGITVGRHEQPLRPFHGWDPHGSLQRRCTAADQGGAWSRGGLVVSPKGPGEEKISQKPWG